MSRWNYVANEILEQILEALKKFDMCFHDTNFTAQHGERTDYILVNAYVVAKQASLLLYHARQNEAEAHRSFMLTFLLLMRIKAMVEISRVETVELRRSQANSIRRRRHDLDDNDGPRPPKRRRSA